MEKIIENFLARIENEKGKYHLTTVEEWEYMCDTFRYIKSGEADIRNMADFIFVRKRNL